MRSSLEMSAAIMLVATTYHGQRLPAEEIPSRRLAILPRDPEPQADGEDHVDDEDGQVEGVERDVLHLALHVARVFNPCVTSPVIEARVTNPCYEI
jgi:hypothetical protein